MSELNNLAKILDAEVKRVNHRKTIPSPLFAVLGAYQLFFGFNFGFGKVTNRKFETLINLITILTASISTIFLAFLIYCTKKLEFYAMMVYFVQYVLTISILFSSKYSLCELLADLISMYQRPLPIIEDRKWRFVWLYLACSGSVNIFIYAVYYWNIFECYTDAIISAFIHIPTFVCEFIPFANFLLFYHIYARLKTMRKEFEKGETHLEQLVNSYRALAELFEKFRKGYDGIFVIGFAADSPKWILIFLDNLTNLKSTTSWLLFACNYTWIFQITKEICVPAVYAEMINVENEAIQKILHERLLVETDESQALKTSRVLKYLKARPLLRKAWRLVPLDLQLPLTMLSLCATYLIVIVQFLHLYD